ncbi:hypothetical protein Vi05172_g844 [Venturia inaequalis]|nr:hypothetical protein Vi05172_g844 [Venturia inaequalis]
MIDHLDTAAMTVETIIMEMIDKEVPTRRSTANAHIPLAHDCDLAS